MRPRTAQPVSPGRLALLVPSRRLRVVLPSFKRAWAGSDSRRTASPEAPNMSCRSHSRRNQTQAPHMLCGSIRFRHVCPECAPPPCEFDQKPLIKLHRLLCRVYLSLVVQSSRVGHAEDLRGAVKARPGHLPLREVLPRLLLVPADDPSCRRKVEIVTAPYDLLFGNPEKLFKILRRRRCRIPCEVRLIKNAVLELSRSS